MKVHISGPSGCGKSLLIEAIKEWANSNGRTWYVVTPHYFTHWSADHNPNDVLICEEMDGTP